MAAAAGMSVFAPARFETLYGVVQAAVVGAEHGAVPADWHLDVERQRAVLADLGRVRPRSDAERRDISKGALTASARC